MGTTRILFFVFLATALVGAIYLYNSINSSIQQTERIAKAEGLVIDKLKMIREAELAYLAVNGQYTSDWSKLIDFVKSGEFYLTQTQEQIFELSYGVDSVVVTIDTLGTIAVLDSLFARQYPDFDANNLPFVPGYENVKFLIWADKVPKSGLMIDVIEVKNPRPFDRTRDEDGDRIKRKPLRFGSQFSVTTTGNWE